MARFIQVFVIGGRIFSVGFWWDDELYPGLFQRVYDSFIGIKSFIGKNSPFRYVRQQSIRAFKIASLSRRQNEINGVTKRINEGMNLGRQSAFLSADRILFADVFGVLAFFLSAPAAC